MRSTFSFWKAREDCISHCVLNCETSAMIASDYDFLFQLERDLIDFSPTVGVIDGEKRAGCLIHVETVLFKSRFNAAQTFRKAAEGLHIALIAQFFILKYRP